MHGQLVTHCLRYTGLRSEAALVERTLDEGDLWFTPQEAVALGVADRVRPALPDPPITQELA